LKQRNIDIQTIDLIAPAMTTPDRTFPSTACLLQQKLGIVNCPAFDLQAVCSGFVYALATADNFIKAGRHAKRALVIGADANVSALPTGQTEATVFFGEMVRGGCTISSSKRRTRNSIYPLTC
jgi:3-oxoacyl-[acyl-carrier-protein] synthase-3